MDYDKFDLVLVTNKFKSSIEGDDDVLLDLYLEAFREILKFVYIFSPRKSKDSFDFPILGSSSLWGQFLDLCAPMLNLKWKS